MGEEQGALIKKNKLREMRRKNGLSQGFSRGLKKIILKPIFKEGSESVLPSLRIQFRGSHKS